MSPKWPVIASAVFTLCACRNEPPEEEAPSAVTAPASVVVPEPVRGIVQVAGNLYRIRNNNHYTVALVTQDGIILSDPINRQTATWMRDELQTRFGQDVKYVLHSHHDFDHASGATVFTDSAEIIGHANFAEGVAHSSSRLNAFFRPQDRNGDGRIELGEANAIGIGVLGALDDGDGAMTPEEMYKDVAPPETLISTLRTVTLGGGSVEMVPLVPQHATDMVVLRFPAERAVFVVDFAAPGVLPGNIEGGPLANWIEAAKQIEALDFDILVPGHGEALGTKADITAYRVLLEELQGGVSQGIERGASVEEIQASDLLAKYSSLPNYSTARDGLIRSAYDNLRGAATH